MIVETVKMSSKGQIVIPQHIREVLHADEGSMFAVIGSGDSVILKKIETPSAEQLIKELRKFGVEGAKNAEKLGIKESEVSELIHKIRKQKKY